MSLSYIPFQHITWGGGAGGGFRFHACIEKRKVGGVIYFGLNLKSSSKFDGNVSACPTWNEEAKGKGKYLKVASVVL